MPRSLSLALLVAATAVHAQPSAAPPAADVQITAAVAPLPEVFRPDATVLGYASDRDGLVPLREGDGAFVCLADDPAVERFHVACYHRSLEPFMARGRALRAEGYAAEVDSIRYAEIDAGTLPMPDHPAALYSLTGPPETFDAATGSISGARPLYVVYIPFATAASTGLPTEPVTGAPWLMFPGTPKAHIMFVPEM
ncbi:MAG: hypothetical protein R3362_10100 [Rhodothermales bacterium]|nr:hypothetical protein [Rhodothermales bacterium]